MLSFGWIPLYRELAGRLVEREAQQAELLAMARELQARGIPVGKLDDQGPDGRRVDLAVVDPFTFFSFFNRETTDENRKAILGLIKERFGLQAAIPDEFKGIPYANNQNSWFFAYAPRRDPGDVPALWALARSAVRSGRAGVPAAEFDRCLAIRQVGVPKLTAGLYWLAPTEFLPCDGHTLELLRRLGLRRQIEDHASYMAFVDEVVKYGGPDFAALSAEAYRWEPRAKRYWAGGHQIGDVQHKDEFVAGNFWRMGWEVDTDEADGKKAWSLLRQVRPGDEFAIKGYGGTNDLVVHYVGEVGAVDLPKARVELRKLDRRLFRDKAPANPGDGSWFKALLEIRKPEAIQRVFDLGGTVQSRPARPDLPLNLILYGPPGTGKTWRVRNQIAPLFHRGAQREPRGAALDEMVADLTWFEAVGAALIELGGRATVSELLGQRIVRAKQLASRQTSFVRQQLWATLQAHTVRESTTVSYERRTSPLVFDKDAGGEWYFPGGPGDELREVAERLGAPSDGGISAAGATPGDWVTFHQSYGYEDFVEGIRPVLEGEAEHAGDLEYRLRDGLLLSAANRAIRGAGFEGDMDAFACLTREERRELLAGAPPQALFIDEINRGNVARIFGELITLIEPDKRLGEENEIIVTLPVSGRRFGVPSNLWIVGTMNTADRSVEALDTALRRRFAFEECRPDPTHLSGIVMEGDVDLQRLLATINGRLMRLYDRDHLIGHSYFTGLRARPTLEELRRVFDRHVLPLLQEYFFSDHARIGLVLGRAFVRRIGDVGAKLAGFDDDRKEEFEERRVFELVRVRELDAVAFRSVYEGG